MNGLKIAKNLDLKKRVLIYLVLITFLIFMACLVHLLIKKIENQIETQILKFSIKDIKSIIKNFNDRIVKSSKNQNVVNFLIKNKAFRKELESDFEGLITHDIKYIYLIFRDEDGKYRFLVDGSLKDKAFLGEIFQPLPEELKLLKKVYQTKRMCVAIHKEIDTLGFTLIDPVIKNNQVEAVIFVDFSTFRFQKIQSIINWLKLTLFVTSGIAFILLTVSLFISIKTYIYRKKAYIDPLTGLYNRNYLNDLELDSKNYTIAMADIDDFKKINDTYGHDIGDLVLKKIASIIKKSIREKEDIAVRFGGEEFLILLKRKDNFKELNALERLMENIRNVEISIGDKKIKTTISIGVDLADDSKGSLFDRIKRADLALYYAKNSGKNRIEFYIEASKKKITIVDLKKALEDKNLIYLYQPIFSLEDFKILGYELLVKLKSKNGFLISSDNYLSILENTFLGEDFIKVVLEHIFKTLREIKSINLFVNVGITNILNKNLFNILEKIPEDLRNRIGLEIKELKNNNFSENFVKIFSDLKKNYNYILGVDDFGESFFNIINLAQIPIDYIKLSCGLVKNIENSSNLAFIETINLFCKKTDIKLIAKCIENEKILNIVKQLNIKYGQGFYLSKPLTEEEIKNLFS